MIYIPDVVKKAGLEKKGYFSVTISASWCGPCQAMKPEIKKAQKAGYAVFVWTTDDPRSPLRDIGHRYDNLYDAYPTTLIFKDGKHIHTLVGGLTLADFKRHLKLNPKKPDYKI